MEEAVDHPGFAPDRMDAESRSPEANALLGQCAFEAARYGEAADIWMTDAALKQFAPSDPYWARVALALRRAGRGKEVADLLKTLSLRGLPNVHVHLQKALAVHEEGQTKFAVAALDNASPDYSPRDRVDIGRVCVQMLADRARFPEASLQAKALRTHKSVDAERIFRFCLAYIERKMQSYELAQSPNSVKINSYWADRRDAVYIHVVRLLINVIAPSANRVADIGSNGTPVLDFFPDKCEKYSVDPASPYQGQGVTAVRALFQDWTPPGPIDVATCFQTIEHVPDAADFAKRLLKLAEVCIVSVPHKEPLGGNPGHVQFMIDEQLITTWFGRAPNYSYIARELDGVDRIICVFDTQTQECWKTLSGHSEPGLRFRYRWSLRNAPEALRCLVD